jgi:hypothetical protein
MRTIPIDPWERMRWRRRWYWLRSNGRLILLLVAFVAALLFTLARYLFA